MNAGVFLDFLKGLIHNAPRKIFPIVDGNPERKAKKVQDWVSSVSDRLRLFVLPPYSPELNPDELVWNDLKHNAIGRKVIHGVEHMRREEGRERAELGGGGSRQGSAGSCRGSAPPIVGCVERGARGRILRRFFNG